MRMWCVYLLVICPLTALSLEDNVHIPRSAPCTDLTLVGQPPASGCYWCLQNKCRCMGDMADCSGNNGTLTFIPRLPDDIRRVNFSHNGLTAIEKGEFFHNVTSISLLDLSGNQLVNLSQDAFSLLINLTHLSLIDNNNLTRGFLLPLNNESNMWRGNRGLRLCDHERDFIPGKNIVNNVVDCVESSKKVLMLFSPNFAQSQWCQFELNLCLRHVMDLQDGLVIVLLEAIPPEELTPAMKAVLYTTTYVEWEEEEVARPIFWNRLRLAMPDIMGQN